MKCTLVTIFFTFFMCFASLAIAQDNEERNNRAETEEIINNFEESLAPLEEIDLQNPKRTDGSDGEKQTFLNENEFAPWPGVLLNPEAIAYIISEFEAFQVRAEATLKLQRESDWNRLQLELGRLQLHIDSIRQENSIVVDGLKKENERLTQIHKDYIEDQTGGFWNSDFGRFVQYSFIVIGAGAVGILVGLVAGGI